MKKLSIKVMKHSALVALETSAAVLAIFCIVALVLFWRMSDGPIRAEFIIPYIEDALSQPELNIRAHIGDARLNWPSVKSPLVVEISQFSLTGEHDATITSLSRLGVELSRQHLLKADISVKGLAIYGPELRIRRDDSGQIGIDFLDPVANVHDKQPLLTPTAPPAPQVDTTDSTPPDPTQNVEGNTPAKTTTKPTAGTSREELFQEMLAGLLAPPDPSKLPQSLKHIEIRDAAIVFEDAKLGLQVNAPRADLVLSRHRDGINGALQLDFERGSDMTQVSADITFERDTGNMQINARLDGFSPEQWADAAPGLESLSHLKMKLKLDLSVQTNLALDIGPVQLLAEGGTGTLDLPGLYPAPVQLKGLAARISATPGDENTPQQIRLEALNIDLDGPSATATATVTRRNGRLSIDAQAEANNMPVDDLRHYWPPAIAPIAYDWVTSNLSDGMAENATLDIALDLPETLLTGEKSDKNDIHIERLGGNIRYSGVTVDYLKPLEIAYDATGTAQYDRSTFSLDITSATASDMKLDHAKIVISNLDQSPARIDMTLDVAGPLKTALEIINEKPLRLPAMLGIDPAKINGNATGTVQIGFPLIGKQLTPSDVAVTTDAIIDDVEIQGLFAGLHVAGGPLTLKVDNDRLDINGRAKIEGREAEVTWQRNFTPDAEFTSRIQADLVLDPDIRKRFGHDGAPWIIGDIPATLRLTEHKNGRKDLWVRADLGGSEIKIDELRYFKPAGEPGKLEATARLDGNRLNRIDIHEIMAKNLNIAGEITMNVPPDKTAPSNLKQVFLDPFTIGGTNASLRVTADQQQKSLSLKISGQSLDVSYFLNRGTQKTTPTTEKDAQIKLATPIRLFADIEHLLTSDTTDLTNAKLYAERDMFSRLEQLELDAIAGNKDLYLRFKPAQGGGHTLHIEAGNAGATLKALNISKSVRGGTLYIKGQPSKKSLCDMGGVIKLNDFRVVNLPALARLLNAMSLTGIEDLLEGNGIRFAAMTSKFRWLAHPDPEGHDLPSLMCKGGTSGEFKFADGKTHGASLGLTFDGSYNFDTGQINLSGTIVPASQVNTLVSNIPLIGEVISGGKGSAVFAATYEIKGPAKDAKVTVNPLAALAPGLLRKLFFEGGVENDSDNENTTNN